MIDHPGIGVADVACSAAFYDAVLGVLGLRRVIQFPETTAPMALAMVLITRFFGLTAFTHMA